MKKLITAQMKQLLRSAITGEPASGLKDINIDEVYELSSAHDMANVVAVGLKNSGYPVSSDFQRDELLAVFRYGQLNCELDHIIEVLKSASISFILLKGSVLRSFYPEPSLRTSADIDILIHKEDMEEVFQLLSDKFSYEPHIDANDHHWSMETPSGMHVELHYSLSETYIQVEDVWDCAVQTEGSQYRMDDIDFFTYHIVHMAEHFKTGGCGMRPFMDLWIMRNRMDMEFDYCKLKECGLEKFAKAAVRLSEVWFGDADGKCSEHTELTEAMEAYILYGGMFGNMENRIAMSRSEQSGAAYLWNRLFLPYKTMKLEYPVLAKVPVLLPWLWIYRAFRMVKEGRSGKMVNELKINSRMSAEKMEQAGYLCRELGL